MLFIILLFTIINNSTWILFLYSHICFIPIYRRLYIILLLSRSFSFHLLVSVSVFFFKEKDSHLSPTCNFKYSSIEIISYFTKAMKTKTKKRLLFNKTILCAHTIFIFNVFSFCLLYFHFISLFICISFDFQFISFFVFHLSLRFSAISFFPFCDIICLTFVRLYWTYIQ